MFGYDDVQNERHNKYAILQSTTKQDEKILEVAILISNTLNIDIHIIKTVLFGIAIQFQMDSQIFYYKTQKSIPQERIALKHMDKKLSFVKHYINS